MIVAVNCKLCAVGEKDSRCKGNELCKTKTAGRIHYAMLCFLSNVLLNKGYSRKAALFGYMLLDGIFLRNEEQS